MGEGVAVDGGVGRGRMGADGDGVAGENAAARGGEGDCLRLADATRRGAQPRERLAHRGETRALRSGEAVIGEGWSGRAQRGRMAHAENPALLARDDHALGRRKRGVCPEQRRKSARRVEIREALRHEPHLRRVAAIARRTRAHLVGEERGIDLGERHRGVGNRQSGLERPDARRAGKARVGAQPRQRGDAGQRLRTDRARGVELPARLRARRARLGEAPLGQAVARACAAAFGQTGLGDGRGAAPERPDPGKERIEPAGDREAVVGVAGAILDGARHPVPEPQRVGRADDLRCEPPRIAERKIEARQRASPRRDLRGQQVGQPRERLGAGAAIGRRLRKPVARDREPDRISGRTRGRGRRARRPVDGHDGVEQTAHRRPASVRMKSAIAAGSSSGSSGTDRPATGSLVATARTVGSSRAIRGAPVAARWTSTLAWPSRL